MADVFLSYASEDRPVAERLAAALQEAGLSVWWDRHIRGGSEFSHDIERELEAAGKVLVLWSKAGNHSRWVRDEASAAAERGQLVGAAIDGSRPPLGFRQFQTLDLASWARRSGRPLPAALLDAVTPAAPAKAPPPKAQARPRRSVLWAAAAALAALVVIGGWWFTRQSGGDEIAAQSAKASLAVAPFTALSTGADDRYLAAGLTEELVAHLTAIPQLSVSSRSGGGSPGEQPGQRETAAALGAEHLVEGTVRRAGQRLRVTARLIRAADGTALWSGSYDSGQGDMLDFQAQIAAKVAAALNVLLSPSARQQMARMQVRNPDAYVALAKGNEAYDRAHSGTDLFPALVEATAHYDQAFRLAPALWQARERSADLYSHLLLANIAGGFPPAFADLGVDGARRELQRRIGDAMRSAPGSAEQASLAVIGKAFSQDWTGLLSLVRESYRRRSSCGLDTFSSFLGATHGLARELGEFGRRTIACNRTAVTGWEALARSQFVTGDAAGALATLDRAEQVVGRDPTSSLKTQRAIVLLQLGRVEEARGVIAAMADPRARPPLEGLILASTGDRAGLEARLSKAPVTALRGIIVNSAWAGDRARANRAAAELDKHPDGPLALELILGPCLCGWPFDLSGTPNYAARLRQAGAMREPPRPIRMPLKSW